MSFAIHWGNADLSRSPSVLILCYLKDFKRPCLKTHLFRAWCYGWEGWRGGPEILGERPERQETLWISTPTASSECGCWTPNNREQAFLDDFLLLKPVQPSIILFMERPWTTYGHLPPVLVCSRFVVMTPHPPSLLCTLQDFFGTVRPQTALPSVLVMREAGLWGPTVMGVASCPPHFHFPLLLCERALLVLRAVQCQP